MKRFLTVCLLCCLPAGAARALDCDPTEPGYDLAAHSLDELFDNGEGKPGPRRLVTEQTSTIPGLGSKLFVQATPGDRDDLGLEIEKLSGSAKGGKTAFVVCRRGPDKQLRKLDEFLVAGGSGTIGLKLRRHFTGLRDSRLTLQLQGRDTLGVARFRIDLQRPGGEGKLWIPNRQAPRQPVKGLADLHVHQAASLAFAGGWLWGSHREGPLNERLPACTGSNHATLQIGGIKSGQALIDPHPDVTHGAPDFHDWPSWKDIKHQQVAAEWLKAAHQKGLQLMVASLVNNQWLAAGMIAGGHGQPGISPADMESVKLQLLSLKQMDEQSDWYTIVRDPWEARRAIARGELAVVLAVEVSDLLPASDGPWKQQLYDLYDMGVRSMQIVHQTNNRFSGAALHRDVFIGFSRIKALFDPQAHAEDSLDGVHNPLGLSPEGGELIDEMVRLKMLIDIAHSPLITQQQVYQRVAQKHAYYPLFNSHTRMDPLLTPADKTVLKEFVTIPETLDYVRRTGGMLGLRTGEDPMETYAPPPTLSHKGQTVANDCDGSVKSFIQFYQYADDRQVSLGLGSDFNGFITQLAPRFGPDACANAPAAARKAQIAAQGPIPANEPADLREFDTKGLAHIGLLPAMVADMQRLGADTRTFESSAEAFLNMWERTYASDRGPIGEISRKKPS